MYKNKNISAFPRLLFLNENMTFGELKKLIYYFARNNFISPLKNRTDEGDEDLNNIYQLDEELKKYKEENEGNEKADK